MGASFTSNSVVFNFMLDLQSGLKDKDKQQVCNNISTSVGILQNNHDNNSVVQKPS